MKSQTPCFPVEILTQVFSTLPQHSLYACTLTSRSWCNAAEPFLYAHPRIDGKNFDAFVTSICPSKNAHIRQNGLAELVRTLDMSGLVYNGRKSLTARIIGRLKTNLGEFIAPQASFTINSLAALSKCTRLHTLNLSLVSEAIPLDALFDTTSKLSSLRTLHIPKAYQEASSKLQTRARKLFPYPPNLKCLYLTGSVCLPALLDLALPPDTLTHITIAHAHKLRTFDIYEFLSSSPLSTNLTHLTLGPNVRNCSRSSTPYMGHSPWLPWLRTYPIIIPHLPSLINLTADIDIILWDTLFPGEWSASNLLNCMAPNGNPYGYCHDPSSCPSITAGVSETTPDSNPWRPGALPALQTLTIFSASGVQPLFQPQDIWDAVDRNEYSRLRTLRVGSEIEWFGEERRRCKCGVRGYKKNEGSSKLPSDDLQDLDELLRALAREDRSQDAIPETRAGVFRIRHHG